MISFVSPCVWPLVPAYLSYVSGVSFKDLADQTRRVTSTTGAFVLGFGAVFTVLGAGAGAIGDALTQHRRSLEIASGLLIVLMGAVLAGFGGMLLQQERRLQPARRARGAARRGHRRRGVRHRLDALRRPDAGRDPRPRRPLGPRARRRRAAGRLLARPRRAVPALGPAVHARAREPRPAATAHAAARAGSGVVLMALGALLAFGQLTAHHERSLERVPGARLAITTAARRRGA